MTLFLGPESIEVDFIHSGFVRREDSISIDPTGNPDLSASDIGAKDGLLEGWDAFIRENPDKADAGEIFISKRHGEVTVEFQAGNLGVPATPEAREQTGQVLRKLCPGYKVEVGHPIIHGWYR